MIRKHIPARLLFLIIGSLLMQQLSAQPVTRPFPQHTTYCKGSIKPSQYNQHTLDQQVLQFYHEWKQKYVRKGCGPGEYYVWFGNNTSGKICVSEGQGYGMMIMCYMAGADADAQHIYNGMFRYYRAHASRYSPYLMAWAQTTGCKNTDGSSATDGDLDIAYSLLLANKQWGSHGSINYIKEARLILKAIEQKEINPVAFNVMLSSEAASDSDDYFDMRSSDFMPNHFRAFYNADHNPLWKKAIDRNYQLFIKMQEEFSPDAGLLPDFIIHTNRHPHPAKPHYLESPFDGCYYYNACRVPWRLSTDYLLNGDPRAHQILQKINAWVRETTQNNPDNLSAGYTLAGNDLKSHYFEALSFICPFAVSASIDSKNQRWLNSVWDYSLRFKLKDFDYYDNTIKLINMIIISGNSWQP